MSEVVRGDSSTELKSFDDLKQQRVTTREFLKTGSLADNPGHIGNFTGAQFEVVGDNFWNEIPANKQVIAECVALVVEQDVLHSQEKTNTDQADPMDVKMDSNFGFQPGREGNVVTENNDLDVDDDGSVEIEQAVSNYENSRYLYSNRLHCSPQVEDVTNGLGAGPAHSMVRGNIIPFRQLFGRGPLLTEEDELTYNGEFFVYGPTSGANAEHTFSATLWWDIHEQEQPEMTDILMG